MGKSFELGIGDYLSGFTSVKSDLVAEAKSRGVNTPAKAVQLAKEGILELDKILKIDKMSNIDVTVSPTSPEIRYLLHLVVSGLFEAIKQHNYYAEDLVVFSKPRSYSS